MKALLQQVRGRVDAAYRAADWNLFGRAQYLAQPALVPAPDAKAGTAHRSFYQDGAVMLDGAPYASGIAPALQALRGDFAEAIGILNDPASKGKKIKRIDARRRQWQIGTESGFIRLLFEDRRHPAFARIFGDAYAQAQDEQRVATTEDLYAAHPFIRRVAEDASLAQLAGYGNGGDARPLVVQLERKTHTEAEGNSMKVHIDQVNGTFKAYLYLTNVLAPEDGALELSKGSHHWKAYPVLLDEIMAKRRTKFTEAELPRFGVAPLSPVFGPAGSFFAFTSNLLHRATNVAPGRERWSVHFYYYATQPWSTEQREPHQA